MQLQFTTNLLTMMIQVMMLMLFSLTKTITYCPTITDDTVFVNAFSPNGQSATLTASPLGVDFDWFDAGNFIGTGDTMHTDTINTTTSICNIPELAPVNMGATNNTFGAGGYFNFFTTDYYLMFTTFNLTLLLFILRIPAL